MAVHSGVHRVNFIKLRLKFMINEMILILIL